LSWKEFNPRFLFLLLLPLLLVLCATYLNNARGPYWMGSNLDPEYVYLLNAANLAMLTGVGHIDHPGTPVQVLGAVTLRIVYALSGTEASDFQTDVLKRPEFYLAAVNALMIVLNALMLLALGVVTCTLTANIWWGLWLQLSPFFFPVLLQFGLTRVTPEPLLFLAGSALVLLMMVLAHAPDFAEKKQWLPVLLAAGIIGFGIANKVTFVPMIVVPLIVFPGIKKRFYFLAASAAAFVIFTLPIIRMYPRFFGWVFDLIGHSGKYGSGPSGLVASDRFFHNFLNLLTGNLFFTIVLLLSLLTVLAVLLVPAWRKVLGQGLRFKLLAAAAAAQVLGVLTVSKHAAHHYLLPVFTLSGMMVFLLFSCGKQLLEAKESTVNRRMFTAVFIAVLIVIASISNPVGKIEKTVKLLNRFKENTFSIRRRMEREFKDYARVYYYRSSAPEYALKFGSDLSRSFHAAALEKMYGGVYFYDIWTGRFSNFDYNKTISFEQIRAKYGDRIVFQGSRGIRFPGLRVKEVAAKDSYEGIFIIYLTPHNCF
jgi:hypothetical protein